MHSKRTMMINSFLLAFLISFVSIFLIYPELDSLLYTNIISGASLGSSGWFFAKVFIVLSGQTGVLGGCFYVAAKKFFK